MNLKKLVDNDYMLRGEDRVIGSYLFDCFNEEVGRIEGLLVDPETFAVRYCMLTVGGFLSTRGKALLLPKGILESKGLGKMAATKSLAVIRDAPAPFDREKVTREEEQEIHDYFDLPSYFKSEGEGLLEEKADGEGGGKTA